MEHFFTEIWQAVSLFFENVDVHELVRKHHSWFYLVAFVWAFLEGETFLIFAGAAAAQGVLDIKLLILAAWAGSVCGDQLYYYLGHRFGPKILDRFPKYKPMADKVFNLINSHGVLFILGYRFLWTIRNVCALVIGFSGYPWKKFTPWNILAALIWAVSFSMVGYVFGEALVNVLGEIHYAIIALVAAVALIFGVKWAVKRLNKSRKK